MHRQIAYRMHCDLRIVPDESFGSALQYFTGSKEHNIGLRTIAIQKGLKLNEMDYSGKKGELQGEPRRRSTRFLG
jgi:DNA polymerase (family 10)